MITGRPSRVLAPLLIVSLFVTHWRFPIAGLHFLPEDIVVLALLVALVAERRERALWAAATDRTALALAAFIAWSVLVTMVQAPDVGKSMAVVGWLGLDWLILVAVLASFPDSERVERLAVNSAAVLGAVALVLGVLAAVAGTTIGTRPPGPAGEARPVFALAYEANILASTLAIWAFVALTSPHPRVRRAARFCVPLAVAGIAFSLTRAAILGFAAGLLVWAVVEGGPAARTVTKILAATLVVGVLATAVTPAATAPVRQRLGHLLDFGSGTSGDRAKIAKTALGDLGGPQLAIGLGTNTDGQRHENRTSTGRRGFLSVLPVQIVYDGGLIGAGLLVLALFTVRPISRPGRARALGALVVFGITAAATSPFWLGSTWLLVALAVMTRPQPGGALTAPDPFPAEGAPAALSLPSRLAGFARGRAG